MQLVAMGAQDVFLTGNPQITFFKVVYRRHTNFSKECIRQEFTGSGTFGSSLSCTLSRNGDLVQEIYLNTTVSAVATKGTTGTGAPNTVTADKDIIKLGDLTRLIKSVEVEIGGQKIDKHYAAWLDIYNELFETNIDYAKNMVGGASASPSTGDTFNGIKQEIFIPLRFWFNRNAGLALPLIALQYHEVKVKVEMEAAANLTDIVSIKPDGVTETPATVVTETTLPLTAFGTVIGQADKTLAKIHMESPQLLVNYVYLDTDERRRFAQVSHEYLIEQVQHTGDDTGSAIDLTYNHPVKAIFWTGATYTSAKLQLNGHDRFSEQSSKYFGVVQPYESGLGRGAETMKDGLIRTWSTITSAGPATSMYSFALKPGEHQPSGTCNFSRIDNARLNLTGHSGSVKVFALNYNVLRVMSGMGGLTYSN